MQTNFSKEQLADPITAEAEKILRRCVHCGLCTATCPTYLVLGDERDSPRGRIYAIKDMMENDRDAVPEVTKHIDRCLSCFSCMTTCPSGVDYMHLVEIARNHIEKTGKRSLRDRFVRRVLAATSPHPRPPSLPRPEPSAHPLRTCTLSQPPGEHPSSRPQPWNGGPVAVPAN